MKVLNSQLFFRLPDLINLLLPSIHMDCQTEGYPSYLRGLEKYCDPPGMNGSVGMSNQQFSITLDSIVKFEGF